MAAGTRPVFMRVLFQARVHGRAGGTPEGNCGKLHL